MSRQDDIKKLLAIHRHHLQKLEEPHASVGSLDAPAHSLTKIEATEITINKLEMELKGLEANEADAEARSSQTEATRIELPARIPLERPRRAEHFIGREQELAQLLNDLEPGKVVTLTGPGGIGKSALAAEAIWTLAPDDAPPDRFPDGLVFYSFYSNPDTAPALEHLVRSFDETARDSSPAAAYRLLSGKRALIVLDSGEAAADLRAVLDVTAGCGVLVTRRNRSDAVAVTQPVNPLPADQAVMLLRAWGQPHVNDETAAQEICRLVGGLPLAVRLVGCYLTAKGETATEYLAWLKETPLPTLDQGQRPIDSVPYLIERSLTAVSAAANQVLTVAGLLAWAPFSRSVVEAALSDVRSGGVRRWLNVFQSNATQATLSKGRIRRALGELVSYGLLLSTIEPYETGHALIHAYARQRLTAPDEALIRLAGYYSKLAEEQSQKWPTGYAILEAERPHLMTVLKRCVELEAWDAVRGLVWDVDSYLDIQGRWAERAAALKIGVKAAQALVHRRDEGAFLGNLGLTYRALGQVEPAIDYHQQALTIAREIGDKHNEVNQLGNLGLAYRALGQIEPAIDYYTQALGISRRIGYQYGIGTWAGRLGETYRELGQVKRAKEYLEQSVAIFEEINSPYVYWSRKQLAELESE